jgi:hypothetical protein
MQDAHRWAHEEFRSAELGDLRRTKRLVALAAAFAIRPAGKVTDVVRGAAREAAFRFVENDAVESTAIADSSHAATGRRCASAAEIIVAVDQTSLKLTDRVGKPGFGRTGTSVECRNTAGLQVMTALAVDAQGVTQGVLGQQWWARHELSPDWSKDKRPDEERESDLWRRTLFQAHEVMRREAPETKAWYQLDRGADSRAVIELALEHKLSVTIRSAYNRALPNGRYLHDWVRSRPILGRYSLQIASRWRREARWAALEVRAAPVEILLKGRSGRVRRVGLYCVHVRERRATAQGQRLEWFLLTTVPTRTLSAARRAISSYSRRWRVEEFHRAWKSGVCNIEHSQLRSAHAFKRWATISAAVAARAERLKHQSRNSPSVPAATELSRDEIDAAIVLSETKKYVLGDALTLEQAVALIAYVGGYIGKSSGGPPGVRVIQRGLERVQPAAAAIRAMREKSG